MSEIEMVRSKLGEYFDEVLLRIRAQAANGAKAKAPEWNPHLASINMTRRANAQMAINATRAQNLSRAIVALIDEEIAKRGLK